MFPGKSILMGGTAVFVVLASTGQALAQDATDDTAQVSEEAEGRLKTVVVTAQRREQSVNDIGIAINAFDSSQLDDLGVGDVGDLALLTPGVNLTETGVTGVPVYSIRGVGFDDYSSNSTSTVGIYHDDVSLPYPTMTREPQYDLGRVEILKGPQGTLYGRNTTAGAINLISNRPTRDFEAGATLGYGRFETVDAKGYISGPVSDTLRYRLSGATTQSGEGAQESSSRPGDRLGKQDKTAARLLVDWDASESVSVLFKLHGYQDKSENSVPQYFAYVPLVPDLAAYFPAPDPATIPNLDNPRSADWSATLTPKRDNEGWGASAQVSWDIGGMKLDSISAYERFDRNESNDWDGTSVENLDVINDTSIDSYSQELRLSGDVDDRMTWVLGAFLSHDEVDESWIALGSQSTIYQGVFGAVDTRYAQETDTAALFAHSEWEFAPNWSLTTGIRYTQEDRSFAACSYDVDGGVALLYSQIDLGPVPGADSFYLSSTPLAQGDCATVNTNDPSYTVDGSGYVTAYGGSSGIFRDSASYDNVSGKLGLDWTPTSNTLLYASISRGFKSGGYNGAASSSWVQLEPYAEETLNAYEVGGKSTLADGRIQLNGSVFYYDYQDKQITGFISDPVFGLLTQILNVPKSNIWGAEADIEWQVTPDFYLRAGVSKLKSEIKEFTGLDGTGNIQNFAGLSLPQTPDWQINGQTEYRRSISDTLYARIGADFAYSANYQTGVDPSPLFYVDDYFVWNGRVGIGSETDGWEVLLWGKNLADSAYYTSANLSNDYWFRTPGSGMTWGVQLDLEF